MCGAQVRMGMGNRNRKVTLLYVDINLNFFLINFYCLIIQLIVIGNDIFFIVSQLLASRNK